MANWHSWVFSNSSRWLGVITFSTMSRDSCGDSGVCVIGTIRPLTLMDGATPAVMKRSDAFLCTINLRKELKSTLLMEIPWAMPADAVSLRRFGCAGAGSGAGRVTLPGCGLADMDGAPAHGRDEGAGSVSSAIARRLGVLPPAFVTARNAFVAFHKCGDPPCTE